MNTVVLKFGGSSLKNNDKLRIVANKIINFKNNYDNIIVIVSAMGDKTDKLITEAKELSKVPNEREYDALLSIGEEESASKLAILLNELGHEAISLNAFQAGIFTDEIHLKARIESINPIRIKDELDKKKIVIIAGFQGIDCNMDKTTLRERRIRYFSCSSSNSNKC